MHWRKIDSAPAGKEILLLIPRTDDEAPWIVSGYKSNRAWRDTNDYFTTLDPSHWLPIGRAWAFPDELEK